MSTHLFAVSQCAKLESRLREWQPRCIVVVNSHARQRTVARALTLFLIAFSVVAVDQFSKYLVRTHMEWGESVPGEGPLRITYTTNTGGAFGLFANQSFLLALAAVIAIAVLVLYLRYLPPGSRLLKIGLGLELGGAIGNLIDRVRLGEVTDFINFEYFPAFNVADASITIGVGAILLFFLTMEGERLMPKGERPTTSGGRAPGPNDTAGG